jgi:ATP/maltotriose-dependent transcriptional regulator MalT
MWAKVSPPILPDIVDRNRLHRRLQLSSQGRVTWVGAPAGSGKTVLIASHIRRHSVPCLWYRVDEGDNDPGTVFVWLRAAAARLLPGTALAVLRRSRRKRRRT